ncbi:hypothetical protein [Lactiplantibacillus plantarum]|uniref:hypothetical protein n=1 Tax=Lactiplantibacillus plantarum TaxID=1590 RepID=UPI001BAA7217|nr:hypothetical protein [Lactiplantibacillus plantarum]MBS0955010.1 hypothetical protein [Lactiplantibacillus plantarum]
MDRASKYTLIKTGCILFLVILSLFVSFKIAVQLLLIAIIVLLGNIMISVDSVENEKKQKK